MFAHERPTAGCRVAEESRPRLIAILDAPGAATYSESEIERFLESRELVLNKLDERAKAGKIDKQRLKVFIGCWAASTPSVPLTTQLSSGGGY